MKIHEYLVRKYMFSDIPFTDFEHDVYNSFRDLFPKEHYDFVDIYYHIKYNQL